MKPTTTARLRRVTFAICVLAAGAACLLASPACSSGKTSVKRIVYEASTANATNVWTIDPTTGATVQITRGTSFDGNPAWSPDRKRIVFVSDRDSTDRSNDIFVTNADGADAHALATTKASEYSPKFSPDGTRIAYATRSPGGEYAIAVMNADGSGQRTLAGPYKFSEFPAWTVDGNEVYFAAIGQTQNESDIYSVDVRTLEVKPRIATPAGDLCPHFSHDGEYVTYATSAPGDGDNVDLFRHELSSDDTSGASDERLTTSGGSDDYGNPSPDDKQYVFVSKRDDDFELYIMDSDGSHQRRLTNTPGVRENVPDW